jgi:hypothetical protein
VSLRAATTVLVLTAGCTGDDSHESPAPTGREHESAMSFVGDLNQNRPQEGTRSINAHLTNRSGQTLTVTSIRLDTAQIASLPPTPKDTTFAPGRTIDVVTQYGEPRCDGEATSESTFEVTLSDGSTQSIPLTRHGEAWLTRLYADECRVAAIRAVASLAYGPTLVRTTVEGLAALRGTLVVRRANAADDEATLTIRGVYGSVLIQLEPAEPKALPAVLRPGHDKLSIPIVFRSFRCDSHARADSTQTFVLSVYAQVPDSRQQRVILVPDHTMQRQIFAMIDDACAGRSQ